MSVKKVVLWPNSALKLVSMGIDTSVVNTDPPSMVAMKALAEDMAVVMGTYEGIGLAAVQIGTPVRVIASLVNNIPRIYINPVIVSMGSETEVAREGCLSLPGIFESVRRATSVVVEFNPMETDRVGARETFTAHGVLARVIQHETEHLDGRLIVDYLSAPIRQRVRGDLAKRRRLGLLRDYR